MADDLANSLAVVSHRIRGGEFAGEVTVKRHGETHTYLAYADQELPVGTKVVVLTDRGNRSVDVTPLFGEPSAGAT